MGVIMFPTIQPTFNRANVQSISIGFWNANDLRSKIQEVRDFVLEQNLDLFLVQETKLEPSQDPLIANYHLYKDDRVIVPRIRTAGVTAIYCKSNFVQSRAPLPGIQYMDATAIKIKINNFPPLRVVSAYARFCAEINRQFPEKDFLKILNSGNNLIIAGDLNAAHKTWNNTRLNNFGFRLKRIIQNYPNARIVATYNLTHINSRSRPGVRDSIIDLAVFKNIHFNYDIKVIDDLCSDHLPVI
ncbi:putative RNA-directed DNA polymerase from transposon X-element [Trichonephila clavipes]|nr:putative RNA-directed DNA polymerase from transposon X-element [Trichonephila clavipes]